MMSKKSNLPVLVEINKQVTKELANREIMKSLIATTFKDFSEVMVKSAIVEGMMRGFEFTDFLQKNVYAIKYNSKDGPTYSLITSIDYARKVGMRSGVIGKSAPEYVMTDNPKIPLSCTITIKKSVGNMTGEFTETVFFDEYTTGKNQWITKPRTMIAKVAEMHALRQACPEELAKAYVEEELQQEADPKPKVTEEDLIAYEEKLESAKDLKELAKFWSDLPYEVKQALEGKKTELKAKLAKDEN